MMKKILSLFAVLILIFAPIGEVFAEETAVSSEEMSLEKEVENGLNDLDFRDIENVAEEGDLLNVMDSFEEIVESLINSSYLGNDNSIVEKLLHSIFSQITSYLPIMLLIVAVAILGTLMQSFQVGENSKSVSDLIHFVCVAVVIVLISAIFKNIYNQTTNCINNLSNQIYTLFPILLTLMTTMGSTVSVGIYQPVVAILTNGVSFVLGKILYPIFLMSFVFVIVGNLSTNVKLNKFSSFLRSLFKWVIGFVFTLFAGFLTIKGISAGKYDTISLKATRFAMKSYVPIIGGYLSDGLDYVMLSSGIIKNAVGVAGLLLMFSSIVVPIISIVIFKLLLQMVSGVLEPIGNARISGLCDDISKILTYPILIILSMAFMYFLSVGLIMCTFVGV